MLCELCSPNVELLAFHTDAEIMVSLSLQEVCRYSCHQSFTYLQSTATENLVKFGNVILEICEWIETYVHHSSGLADSEINSPMGTLRSQ